MVLVGVHPSLMHVPPTCSRSISAVFHPLRASAPASGPPAWPAPMIMASYCRGVPMVQLVYSDWEPFGCTGVYKAMLSDLRYALRGLRRNPAFALAAILA